MKDLNDEERAQIILTVEENKKGEYWNILSGIVKDWVEEENDFIASFRNGIKQEQVDAYNRAIERRDMCLRFLTINEEIIEIHLTVIQRAKKLAGHLLSKIGSFVGMKKDLAGNGQK